MKLTSVLLLVTFFNVFGSKTYSQYKSLNLDLKDVPIQTVLSAIEGQSEFFFLDSSKMIDVNQLVDIQVKNKKIDEVLDNLLANTDIKYTLKDRQILLVNKEAKTDFPAQQSLVTGKITDSQTGEAMPGVNIQIKGSTIGSITDAAGVYSISVTDSNATLVFSFIGYFTQEIALGGQSVINVALSSQVTGLDEVVVIGYGTVKKRDLTGSVASIQTKDLANSVVTNVGQMIQGKASGVEISSSDGGTPGAMMDIKIRGTTTLNNTAPLTIIDGMIGDFNMVAPNEIESIDILKDASSAAIYGSRGANGVIIVTTKKGSRGAPRLSYDGYAGVSTPGKKLDVLKADDYVDLVFNIQGGAYDPATKHWLNPGGADMPVIFNNEAAVRTDSVDMQDEVLRNAAVQSHNISMQGGTDMSKYRFSAGYFDQGSTRGDYRYTRYNFKSNTEFKIGKHVTVGNNTLFRYTKTSGLEPGIMGALQWAPYMPVKSATSTNPENYSNLTNAGNLNDASNPMATMAFDYDNSYDNKLLTQIYGRVTLLEGLEFNSQFQYEYDSYRTMDYREKDYMNGVSQTNFLEEQYSVSAFPKFENYLTYTKTLGPNTISAMAGISYENGSSGRSITVKGTGYGGESMPIKKVTVGSDIPVISNQSVFEHPGMSYFGRINYSLHNRYLLTANFRADASYKFAPANRWGYFPSISAAWRIKDEAFLRDVEFLSDLKIRASWGKAGNDQIIEYAYASNIYTGGYSGGDNIIIYPFGPNNSIDNAGYGASVNTLPSTDIRWEETTTKGLGFDFGFLKNQLLMTIDYYDKFTDGILIPVPVPLSTGINNPTIKNAATVTNRGVDMQLTYNGQITSEIGFSVSVVAGYNKNNVTSLGEGQPIFANTNQATGYMSRTESGKPIAYFFGYKTDGILYTQADADAYNEKYGQSSAAGDLKFLDINGDGNITDADRTELGNPMPSWTYGLNLTLLYKGFDFQLTGSGLYGNELINFNRAYWLEGGVRPFNGSTSLLNRWRYDGDIQATLPRVAKTDPNKNTRFSNRYVEDGSFARLKTITVGYTLDKKVLANVIQSLRVYTTIENAVTITKYKGYDPEVGDPDGSGTMDRGIDYSGIPLPRNYLLGVQVTF
jgi:TonB-linked SusC/RagA family outer membrane protein